MARHEPNMVEQASRKVQDWEEGVEDKIKENPVQSVLIAFGVGLLAGAIVASLMKKR
jgi:ElaB/YqjD/DUF883 family membrane-anchored ribosome-binding protein